MGGRLPGGSLPVRDWEQWGACFLGQTHGKLADGVPCLGNHVVTNSMCESELCKLHAEKLYIVLVQDPAVRVTKLWILIFPWWRKRKNLFSRLLQNSVSTPAELWIGISIPCFSWASTDVALVLLCPDLAAVYTALTFCSSTAGNTDTCQWLLDCWVQVKLNFLEIVACLYMVCDILALRPVHMYDVARASVPAWITNLVLLSVVHPVTTLRQRLLQPDFQPICASQLYPRHKHLLIKRSLRCRVGN